MDNLKQKRQVKRECLPGSQAGWLPLTFSTVIDVETSESLSVCARGEHISYSHLYVLLSSAHLAFHLRFE